MNRFRAACSVRPVKSNLDLLLGLRIEAFASAAELPKRMKVLGWGENRTASGRKATVGLKTLAVLAANQAKFGFGEIALDYQHNTVPGTKAYEESAEPRPVAAFGPVEVVRGEGLFLAPSRWTPSGAKNALEFQDLSPAPATDENGEVIFVHSVALCRQGDVDDLHFVPFSVGSGNQEAAMDHKAELCKMLKLDPTTATDADISKAIAAVTSTPAPEPMAAKVSGMESKLVTLTADLAGVKAADLKRQRDAITDKAVRDGKVIPLTTDQIGAMDLATLSTLVEKLPSTVPLDQRTPRVEPLTAQGGNPVIAQYNAIKDPVERARFYSENRTKILGNG